MVDYRPLLQRIIRLADRGTFSLNDWGDSNCPSQRWEAGCVAASVHLHVCGKDPGTAVRRLLAALEKGRRDG